MNKILVIQTAFIGDVILATAVLEKLHEVLPESQLFFLVRKGNETLFTDHPFLKEVLVWNKQEGKYASLYRMAKRIRKEKFDLVIDLHRFASSGILTLLSGAKKTTGFSKNPLSFLFSEKKDHRIGAGYHETQRNHSLIASFTGEHPAKPRLYPLPAHFEKVKPYKEKKYVCMAPASVWHTKQWPAEKWIELCKEFTEENIFLIGGPSDRVLCSRIIAGSKSGKIKSLAGELNFLESAALMRDAQMNFVNDSGPMHLASAMNAPVTAIFCSTVPEFGFFPLSDKSYIVQAVEELECRPCGLHGFKRCPEDHFKCAWSIQAERVKNSGDQP